MRALLLIDIQNDFLPGGALAVPDGNLIIPLVNKIQPMFSLVVATQDWHPKEHKSFASNHALKSPFEKVELKGMEQVLWPDHCVQSSDGAAFSKLLDMNQVETIFRKGMDPEIDSYSGFYDNGHLKTTGLADYLRARQVDEVFLAGLAGDYCVYYSALDALKEGFKTYLIEDATRAIDPEGFQKAKSDIIKKGGKVIVSGDIG